jgi:hypothetical protein
MVKFMGADVTAGVPYIPLVAGLVTVTGTVPAVAIALCGILAMTSPELSNVVVMATPLNFTTAPDAKFAPSTVSEKPGSPCVALLGES